MTEQELQPRRLADFLRERRERILERWKQEVARLRPATSLSEPLLIDHMPEFLEGLEQYVGDVRAGLSALPDPAIPRIHAVERLGLGFELGDVVEEYTILRACITELVADEQPPAARSAELPRLHQAIDRAIAASVQRYEQEAATLRGELGAEAARQRSLALERLRQLERHAAELEAHIGERKRIEEELRAAVEFSERIRGVLGHDLRNPLAVVTASASLLQATQLDAQQQRAAARIQSAAQRIARMTHDLLDYTRARVGGGIPVTRRPADAGQIARQVVDEAEVLGADRIIEFSAEGDLGGEWDADRLNQALWNLLDNALRYGAPGDPVSVSARAEGAWVKLAVHNRGPPIAEETLPFLFQPFRRGSHAPAGRGAGLGLGLYIVGEIARAHGGELRARSTGSDGTTFELLLPRASL